jgi:SPP1 family predicted phage head-tail adaptor
MMRAGDLRHRVTIQLPVESQNDFGEVITTWQDYKTVWAVVLPLTGREYFASRQVNAEVTVQIQMRYIPGITPKMRVVEGSKVYEIEAVMDVEGKKKELQLLCTEVV